MVSVKSGNFRRRSDDRRLYKGRRVGDGVICFFDFRGVRSKFSSFQGEGGWLSHPHTTSLNNLTIIFIFWYNLFFLRVLIFLPFQVLIIFLFPHFLFLLLYLASFENSNISFNIWKCRRSTRLISAICIRFTFILFFFFLIRFICGLFDFILKFSIISKFYLENLVRCRRMSTSIYKYLWFLGKMLSSRFPYKGKLSMQRSLFILYTCNITGLFSHIFRE